MPRANSVRGSHKLLGWVLLVAQVSGGCGAKPAPPPATPAIRDVAASGRRYGVVEFFLDRCTIGLYWKAADGTRIGTLEKLNTSLAASGSRIIFAANAGIFDPTFSPCGLYVENHRELVPLNLKTGTGNFYLQPNGVFLIGDHGAATIESSQYPSLSAKPRLATQSGPLLLINGKINPQFATHSTNRRIRSGVGVISPNHIVFVISREPVTFYELASFFQTTLGCTDALYLDGEISRFYPDQNGPSDPREDFAGMFAVTASR